MMISTRGRYALRFLIALSKRGESFSSLSEIAAEEEISPKYLEKIAKILLSSGIIEAQRGKDGGYRLIPDASSLRVSEVLALTEDSLAPVECLCCDSKDCSRRENCPTRPMWEALYRNTMDFFSSVTISDLKNGTYDFQSKNSR